MNDPVLEDKSLDLRWGYISICVVYTDDDLIELKTSVSIGDWSALGTCYASKTQLLKCADDLERWALAPSQEHILAAGVIEHDDWLKLRFYEIDMAGHIVCDVSLSTTHYGGKYGVRRCQACIPTEPGLVQRFAMHLRRLAETSQSDAILEGVQPSR